MLDIPKDKIIVIIDDIPSGIAATAKDIESINISKNHFSLLSRLPSLPQ